MLSLSRSRLAVKILGSPEAFKAAVLSSDKRGLVAWFTASWCGPCKSITPYIEKLSQSNTNIDFLKVDIDSNHELAEEYQVASVPTLILIKGGKPVDRVLGANQLKIEEMVKKSA